VRKRGVSVIRSTGSKTEVVRRLISDATRLLAGVGERGERGQEGGEGSGEGGEEGEGGGEEGEGEGGEEEEEEELFSVKQTHHFSGSDMSLPTLTPEQAYAQVS
jgi:hypothetical protein